MIYTTICLYLLWGPKVLLLGGLSVTVEQDALKIAVEIFELKCNQLLRHRKPTIFQKGNNELFSNWFEDGLENYTLGKLGANAHPDLIINDVGFELKSLQGNGQIQFNSTIPCGGFRHRDEEGECYYAIARYVTERNYGYLDAFTICDGDYFNYNREFAFSHHNEQETDFGNYGDGVVRYRKMYSFPSPLRQVDGVSLISKYDNISDFSDVFELVETIDKEDTEGTSHTFYVYRHNQLR